MLLFRNAATREVVVGAENKVEQCTYAAVLTRVETELDNEITGGWKVVEVCYQKDFGILTEICFFQDGTEIGSGIFIVAVDFFSSFLCVSLHCLFAIRTSQLLHPHSHPSMKSAEKPTLGFIME